MLTDAQYQALRAKPNNNGPELCAMWRYRQAHRIKSNWKGPWFDFFGGLSNDELYSPKMIRGLMIMRKPELTQLALSYTRRQISHLVSNERKRRLREPFQKSKVKYIKELIQQKKLKPQRLRVSSIEQPESDDNYSELDSDDDDDSTDQRSIIDNIEVAIKKLYGNSSDVPMSSISEEHQNNESTVSINDNSQNQNEVGIESHETLKTNYNHEITIDTKCQSQQLLQRMYSLIDKKSSLRSCLREYLDYNKRRITRNGSRMTFTEPTNLGKAQIGYGELRIGSFQKVLQKLQALDKKIIEQKLMDKLQFSENTSYNLNENSMFLDIGSGFGKPVFHTAFSIGCISHGIEVVPARHQVASELLQEFSQQFDNDRVDNVSFEQVNATTCERFKHQGSSKDFTHILSFNKVMGEEVNRGIAEVLNRTNFKVLAWTSNIDETTKKFGVQNVFLVDTLSGCISTGGESFTFYFYCKKQTNTQNNHCETSDGITETTYDIQGTEGVVECSNQDNQSQSFTFLKPSKEFLSQGDNHSISSNGIAKQFKPIIIYPQSKE